MSRNLVVLRLWISVKKLLILAEDAIKVKINVVIFVKFLCCLYVHLRLLTPAIADISDFYI